MNTARLGDIVAEFFDRRGVTPEKLGSNWSNRGHRVISAKQIKQGRVLLEAGEDRFVDDATYRRWMRTPLRQGDVLLTSEAPLGELAYIAQDLDWCIGQRLFALRPRGDVLHGRYLYYALHFGLVRDDLVARATGTTVVGIRQSELRHVRVPLPPMAIQIAIASILGALDDKIDLNRRLNETLEATARALFKSWFIDFDPVRAKAEGRQPFGMDAETAALFPDQLEDGSPIGWLRAPLREWVTPLSGGTPSKGDARLWNGPIPWISPKVMQTIHADAADAYVSPHAIGNGTRLAPPGATLVMVRGMGLHEGVRVSQARCELAFNQDVKALVPRGIAPELLLFALLDGQGELLGRVESSGHGTGVLPTETLLAHVIVMPPSEVQRPLANVLASFNDRIAASRAESRTLTTLRDYLLPKLLSGELRVRDAEKAVEAVA